MNMEIHIKKNGPIKAYTKLMIKYAKLLNENAELKKLCYKKAVKDYCEIEAKLEQTEKDLADYQFNYPTIKELEEENADLKEKLANAESSNEWYRRSTYGSLFDQITKAKKIIKDLCVMVRELNKPNVQLTDINYSLAEAEQFLKDSEVKK